MLQRLMLQQTGKRREISRVFAVLSGKILERRWNGMRQTAVHKWESESETKRIRLECTSLQSRNRVAYETADRPLGRSCVRGEWGLPERYINSSTIATTVTVHAGLAIESSFNFLRAINRVLSLFLQPSSSIRAVANSG